MEIGIPETIVKSQFIRALKNECMLELMLPISELCTIDVDSVEIRTSYVMGPNRPDIEHENVIPESLNMPYVWEPVSGHFINKDSRDWLILCFCCPSELRNSLDSEFTRVEKLSGLCAVESELYIEIDSASGQIIRSFMYKLPPGYFECCETTVFAKEAAKTIPLDSSCYID